MRSYSLFLSMDRSGMKKSLHVVFNGTFFNFDHHQPTWNTFVKLIQIKIKLKIKIDLHKMKWNKNREVIQSRNEW